MAVPKEETGARSGETHNRAGIRYLRHVVLARITPESAIEIGERNTAPAQVARNLCSRRKLDVHHHEAGLLKLPDLPEPHFSAAAGRQTAARTECAQVTRIRFAQNKEQKRDRSNNKARYQ